MPVPERSLLDRRLIIVTGKGGCGKTSVSAALALAAARAGRRVMVAEVGDREHLPRLFLREPAEPVGYAGREIHPGVSVIHLQPYAALAEYLGLQTGARPLVDLVLRNKGFRQLMDASPGWRELITLGKVWHLEQKKESDGSSAYDLVVVDAPATGHGITFLDVPRVVVSAVRAGPLRRHAGWVEELIHDRSRTLLLPVSLAEELPTQETCELVERMREDLGIAIDRVVVNAVLPPPFPPGLADLDETLAGLDPATRLEGLPAPATLAACAAHLRSRYDLNQRYVARIARETGYPVTVLPHLDSGVESLDDVSQLADAIGNHPEEVAA